MITQTTDKTMSKTRPTSERAASYAQAHSTGNSYYDAKLELAYKKGAEMAIMELGGYMLRHLTPYYQQKMNNKIKEMNGE